VATALRQYRRLLAIEAPGTLDGGDVMRVGKTIYVGQSARSNAAAVAQLQALLSQHGYRVEAVPMRFRSASARSSDPGSANRKPGGTARS
jgi:dimethylargininase